MEIICNPERVDWPALTERNIPDDDAIADSVVRIVGRVRREGDVALRDYALEFDGAVLERLELTPEERRAAAAAVSPEVKDAIARAAKNIAAFHAAQRQQPVDMTTQPGVRCLQRAVPIRRVGLYVPGGQAPLFSTVLMLGMPARIAGCEEVVLCTPQNATGRIAPEILYAAEVCGIDRVFRIGGAQAVAAMAYGTESVPRVDKIFGPGNRYVTKAKQLVTDAVAIDMPAGPSEVLVLADDAARPEYVAADLLSQAEHGPDSQAILVCHDLAFAHAAAAEVERQAALLRRSDSVARSLVHSRIIVLDDEQARIDFADAYAAEHLIVSTRNPWDVAAKVSAAGSVFIGNYSPESAGDYASGTNHTLPTSGWARAFSGVNLDSFQRKMTYQELTPEGLSALAPVIVAMAEAEGLDAHAAAVKVRLGAGGKDKAR